MFKPLYMKQELYGRKLDKAKKMISKLNQEELKTVALSAPDYSARAAAVEKLTDQAVLTDIAKKDSRSFVRRTAARRYVSLTDAETFLKWLKENGTAFDNSDKVNFIETLCEKDSAWLNGLSEGSLEFALSVLASQSKSIPASITDSIISCFRNGIHKDIIQSYGSKIQTGVKSEHVDNNHSDGCEMIESSYYGYTMYHYDDGEDEIRDFPIYLSNKL